MSMAWLKKGKAAEQAFEQAEAKAAEQQKKAEAAKDSDGISDEFVYKYRYWMKQDTENTITFLDGDLNENGILEEVCYDEHQIKIGSDWKNFFPCTADDEPCPLCAAGEKKAFVAVFTVIDHHEWTDKNGVIHRHDKRLYAVKRDTLKLLRKYAIKHGGLRGATFEVTRMGDKSPAVGTSFDFEGKQTTDEIIAAYGDADPLKYEEVIQYKDAKTLVELGLGAEAASIGSESGPTGEIPDLSTSL